MELLQRVSDSEHTSALQKQAIEAAKSAYARLPHGDKIFQQCVQGRETLAECLNTVEHKYHIHKKKRSTRFMAKLEKYTAWLRNISSVIDVAIQTQAGIGCPLWAPIKFVLKVSNDQSSAAERVVALLDSITECLPRLEIYEKLQSDSLLQVALLNIFTDVVDFSVRAFQFFRRGTLVRLTQTIISSFDQDIGAVIVRLERHAKAADSTAIATELLKAQEFRQEAERKQQEDFQIQLERWLKPSHLRQVHQNQVEARLHGTCDWITSVDLFEKWIDPAHITNKDRLLAISGTHGCGKSILSSSIVVRLQNAKYLTLFFSFSSLEEGRQTSENLIRTILWQLLREINSKETLEAARALRLDGQPTGPELWEVFKTIALLSIKPVFCVIDGIDECNDFDCTVSAKLMHVVDNCPSLRILLLGRPHVIQTIPNRHKFGTIGITSALLSQDIESLISDEIARSDILSFTEIRESVYNSLKDKSDGMFLWVKLMIEDLKKSSSRSEIRQRLQDLPRGLEQAYKLTFLRLCHKLDKFQLRLAMSVLAFAIIACRPLQFEEFRHAYALHCSSLQTARRPLKEYLILQSPQEVINLVGGLVSVSDGFLRLIHSSVKEFLIRAEDRWIGESEQAILNFRVEITLTHRLFAWLCLDYLRTERVQEVSLSGDSSQSTSARATYPFLGYATLYTFHHLNRSGCPCSTTVNKIEFLLASNESVFWLERFTHLLYEDLTLTPQFDEFEKFMDLLANAGLTMKLSAVVENSLESLVRRMRTSGKIDHPYTEQLRMYQDLLDQYLGTSISEQSNLTNELASDSNKARPDGEPRSLCSRSTSKDPSAAISQIIDLLKGHTSLSTARQIELCLKLQTSLSKCRILIDPLRLLFQLILKKASAIPVFALMQVGYFYERVGKYREAIEVYSAAGKKIHHLDIPLKFRIQEDIGDCHQKLGEFQEALEIYSAAAKEMDHRDIKSKVRIQRYIGYCYVGLGKIKEALEVYTTAANIDYWDKAGILKLIGDCHLELGEFQKALDVYSTILTMEYHGEPTKASILGCMGSCHYELREYEVGLELCSTAIKELDHQHTPPQLKIHQLIGDKAGILEIMGDCYLMLKEYRKALDVYSTILTIESHRDIAKAPILKNTGFCYYMLREYEAALQVYSTAIKELDLQDIPLKFEMHKLIGDCYYDLSFNMEALVYYERAFNGQEILLGQRSYDTLNSLYWMIATLTRLESTEGNTERVLQLIDKLSVGQTCIPELSEEQNVDIRLWRRTACRISRYYDGEAHMGEWWQIVYKSSGSLNLYWDVLAEED